MKQFFSSLFICFFLMISCKKDTSEITIQPQQNQKSLKLELAEAKKIIALPLHCLEVEYPNKLGQVLKSSDELKSPKQLRPIFYGCFDWHSSAHGYWSVVELVKQCAELARDKTIGQWLPPHL